MLTSRVVCGSVSRVEAAADSLFADSVAGMLSSRVVCGSTTKEGEASIALLVSMGVEEFLSVEFEIGVGTTTVACWGDLDTTLSDAKETLKRLNNSRQAIPTVMIVIGIKNKSFVDIEGILPKITLDQFVLTDSVAVAGMRFTGELMGLCVKIEVTMNSLCVSIDYIWCK